MTGSHSFSLVLLSALSALMLFACGGSAPGMAPKAAEQEAMPEPTTPEDALSQIDQASRQLELALGGSTFASPPGEPPPPPPPSVAADQASPEAPAPAARKEATMAGGAAAPMSSDPCSNACRALSSMERATLHLCGLAGERDARCEGARARVKDAGERVRAQCPACNTGN